MPTNAAAGAGRYGRRFTGAADQDHAAGRTGHHHPRHDLRGRIGRRSDQSIPRRDCSARTRKGRRKTKETDGNGNRAPAQRRGQLTDEHRLRRSHPKLRSTHRGRIRYHSDLPDCVARAFHLRSPEKQASNEDRRRRIEDCRELLDPSISESLTGNPATRRQRRRGRRLCVTISRWLCPTATINKIVYASTCITLPRLHCMPFFLRWLLS